MLRAADLAHVGGGAARIRTGIRHRHGLLRRAHAADVQILDLLLALEEIAVAAEGGLEGDGGAADLGRPGAADAADAGDVLATQLGRGDVRGPSAAGQQVDGGPLRLRLLAVVGEAADVGGDGLPGPVEAVGARGPGDDEEGGGGVEDEGTEDEKDRERRRCRGGRAPRGRRHCRGGHVSTQRRQPAREKSDPVHTE